MTTIDRDSWLVKVLGPAVGEKMQAVLGIKRSELNQAAAVLDAAGLQRKENGSSEEEEKPTEPPAPPTPPEAEDDPVMKVAGQLTEHIRAGIEGDYSQLTDEKLKLVLADAMRAAMPAESAAPTDEEEEEKPMAEDSKEMSEAAKALTDTLASLVRDQGEMARELMQMKSLLPVVEQLAADVKRLNEQLGSRPRAASDAPETEIPSSKESDEVKKEIEKGLKGGETTFLGVPVRSIPK